MHFAHIASSFSPLHRVIGPRLRLVSMLPVTSRKSIAYPGINAVSSTIYYWLATIKQIRQDSIAQKKTLSTPQIMSREGKMNIYSTTLVRNQSSPPKYA